MMERKEETILQECKLMFEKNLLSPSMLEELMFVVTVYLCKLCDFACGAKPGLVSHICSCHLEGNLSSNLSKSGPTTNTTTTQNHDWYTATEYFVAATAAGAENDDAPSPYSDVCDTAMDDTEEGVDIPMEDTEDGVGVQESEKFLCGECNREFDSLEQCTKHIIENHNFQAEEPAKKTVCKALPESVEILSESEIEDFAENDSPNSPMEDSENKSSNSPRVDSGNKSSNSSKEDSGNKSSNSTTERIKEVRRILMANHRHGCVERRCRYRFTTEANLRYHARCHTADVRPFKCVECQELFQSWNILSLHLWKEHSINIDLYACDVCDYKSNSLCHVDSHKLYHSEDRNFTCTTCGKRFKNPSDLRLHQWIHMGKKRKSQRDKKKEECGKCGRSFATADGLRDHQQLVHYKKKPFICSICGHAYSNKQFLQKHIKNHTGEKPYLCDKCDFRTKYQSTLKTHLMQHTGDTRYKCNYCSYACIQAISYKNHMKRKHPGLKGIYTCQLCNFRSVNKDNYITHLARHKEGEPPSEPQPVESTQHHTEGSCEETFVACDDLNALLQEVANSENY